MIPRLGILGGTFDPIHHGHLVAAQEALDQLRLDRVLFVPAGTPPHKPARPVSPADDRLRMIELAIAGKPQFGTSRVDLDRPGPHYTADALRLLRAEWGPDVAFFFIAGADSLQEIGHWYRPERILEESELAIVGRSGAEPDLSGLEAKLPALRSRLHWVAMPLLEISSSDLRKRVREGRPISFLVPAAVEAYISQEGLYR